MSHGPLLAAERPAIPMPAGVPRPAEDVDRTTRLLMTLADLLDYPRDDQAELVATCRAMAEAMEVEALPALAAYDDFRTQRTVGQLEEAYTAYFDLNPVCTPYVGHLLFGETYKRSAFLVTLGQRYRAHGFEMPDSEIADRLSVMLRFMATHADHDERLTLASEGLLPALARLTGAAGLELVEPVGGSDSNPKLEGHSEGEVLAPGFLLGATDQAGADDLEAHPYRRLLEAARLLLIASGLDRPAPEAPSPEAPAPSEPEQRTEPQGGPG